MKKLGAVGVALALFGLAPMGAPAIAQPHSPRLVTFASGSSVAATMQLVPSREERRRRTFHGYGGYLYEGLGFHSVSRSRHIGFFAEGGEAAVANGRAYYDYDRGYPYDHYAFEEAEEDVVPPPREHWCSTQWVRDGRERVPVRVCRN